MKKTINISSAHKYISGKKFSSGLRIVFNNNKIEEESRIDKIRTLVCGKRVIHLGFTDHISLIKTKIENRVWLHGLLEKDCSECFGIDINREAVEFIKKEYGYDNTVCANILTDDVLNKKQGVWDYIILGEILEHIENPVHFIETIRKKYHSKIRKIIITVPNIFCRYHAKNILKGIEHINTDHCYWFSPYTILKVAHEAGLKNCILDFAQRCPLNFWELSIRKVKNLARIKSKYPPNYFLGLILTANF